MNTLRHILCFLDEKQNISWSHCCCYPFLFIFYEVCMRYLFHAPTDWAEELSRYIFVYMSYIAAALAVKGDQHIKVDIIRQYLPPVWQQKGVDIFVDLCMIALSIVIMITALQIMKVQWEMKQLAEAWTLIKLNFNMAFAYAALPVSCLLIITRSIQQMIVVIKRRKD